MSTDTQATALDVVVAQLDEAIAASKCHACGCFQKTAEALGTTMAGQAPGLAAKLEQSRRTFKPIRYDCLGCEVCFPAIAANAFGEAFPQEGATLDLCPTEDTPAREGWPPLPGDYIVVRARAPVAVCTLNSDALAAQLGALAPLGLAIVGTLHTENLGIERIIKNVVSNPAIRFLVIAGVDTRRAIGHLPGQSLQSLIEAGVDEQGRIHGARGKRPILKNVTAEEITTFRQQIELIVRIGEENEAVVAGEIEQLSQRDPGPFASSLRCEAVPPQQAAEPARLTLDPAGYLIVYPDARHHRLVLEHYSNKGVLDGVLEGRTPTALYATAIEKGFVTRLDHAAYLGRELARAESNLLTGAPYVQDRAPGQLSEPAVEGIGGCGCGPVGSCS